MDKIHIKKKSEVDKKELLDFYQHSLNLKNINLEDYNWRYRYGFKQYEPLVSRQRHMRTRRVNYKRFKNKK